MLVDYVEETTGNFYEGCVESGEFSGLTFRIMKTPTLVGDEVELDLVIVDKPDHFTYKECLDYVHDYLDHVLNREIENMLENKE